MMAHLLYEGDDGEFFEITDLTEEEAADETKYIICDDCTEFSVIEPGDRVYHTVDFYARGTTS